MKLLGKELMISAVMGLVFPGILLNLLVLFTDWPLLPETECATVEPVETEERACGLTVFVRDSAGIACEMDLDTYLEGVILAEMPVSFGAEALKAQAVVARTYAWKARQTGGKHGDSSVCRNPSCCQGYLEETLALQSGGGKVKQAVAETSGQVLTYQGELIEATYFSCSGGKTEAAVAVWGTDFSYLQAVESPGEENASHYRDTVVFTPEELEERLSVELRGEPDTWVEAVCYTQGGGVDRLTIGGTTFRGTEVRTLLGLPSTAFAMSMSDQDITITTRGYGHRVGMSQYGANAMAADGCTYEEILARYYQGAELTEIDAMG